VKLTEHGWLMIDLLIIRIKINKVIFIWYHIVPVLHIYIVYNIKLYIYIYCIRDYTLTMTNRLTGKNALNKIQVSLLLLHHTCCVLPRSRNPGWRGKWGWHDVGLELDHFLQLHLVGALEHEWIMTYIQLGMVSPADWYFSYTSIGNVIIPIDFHSIIFQRGRDQPPVMIKVLRIADSSGGTSGPRDSGRRFWQTSTCHEEWMHLGVSKKLLLFAKIAICLWWTCWTCLNSKGDLHGFTMIWSTLIYGHLKHMYPKVNDDTRLRIYRDWCPKE